LSEPIIDPDTFAALGEMAGSEFVGELVDTFFEEAPRMIADLHEAYAKGDADVFRRTAHSLKSNSNTFGATQLGIAARDLELGGLEVATPAALEAIDRLYAQAEEALKALCNG